MEPFESFDIMKTKLKYISILLRQEPLPHRHIVSSFCDMSGYFCSETYEEDAKEYLDIAQKVRRKQQNLHKDDHVHIQEYTSFVKHWSNAIQLAKLGDIVSDEFSYHFEQCCMSIEQVLEDVKKVKEFYIKKNCETNT